MSLDRTAKGIVLVPSLLLGGAFLAAAVWGGHNANGDLATGTNRQLALSIGAVLIGGGLLAQLMPSAPPKAQNKAEPAEDEG